MKTGSFFTGLFAALILLTAPPAHAGDKVFFYMHGSDMHGKSPNHKKGKNWDKVVAGIRDATGAEVVFEFRTERDFETHTAQTLQMVKDRIAAGTPPEDIIIGGFSYGATVALNVAAKLGNDKVRVVTFCGCRPNNDGHSESVDFASVKGRVFSVVDTDDHIFASCEGQFPAATNFTEKTITSGKGHSVFKRTRYFDIWLMPFVEWLG